MKVKTSDLTGAALAYVVASLEGYTDLRPNTHRFDNSLIMTHPNGGSYMQLENLRYDLDGNFASPIIEREKISLYWERNTERWDASMNNGSYVETGTTHFIAAMRCYCCAELGDEVDIPEELL